METETAETNKFPTHIDPNIRKLEDSIKNSINELLREIDIGTPAGINVPECILLSLSEAMVLKNILHAISDIDDVVGDPGRPCPVQSQDAIKACRAFAGSNKIVKASELNYLT